jgi:hypothetical protein
VRGKRAPSSSNELLIFFGFAEDPLSTADARHIARQYSKLAKNENKPMPANIATEQRTYRDELTETPKETALI